MIVVDSSAMVRLLLRLSPYGDIDALTLGSAETLHAPHLLDVEVAHALRRIAAAGEIGAERGLLALEMLRAFDIERHAHGDLLPRVWSLRRNFTAYDALYVALAESLDARLLTRDGNLSAAIKTHTGVKVL
ncbi:MAG: type II toxin-antitoxin system VapC family toxin [Caulobacteraceae bacterium]|nr:type II toxin-antitoxin system VapC family toxin [Caulobacteraceae bacterium]